MTITIFGPPVGENIGPGNCVGVSTDIGVTALDDFFEVLLRETSTSAIVCSGSRTAAGATTQIVFHGLSLAFPLLFPTGGFFSFAAGTAIRLEARLYHHSFGLADGPLIQTGFFWDPVGSLFEFIQSVGGLYGGTDPAVLAAVQRTYPST